MYWTPAGCPAALQVTERKERKGHSPGIQAFKITSTHLAKSLHIHSNHHAWWGSLHAWLYFPSRIEWAQIYPFILMLSLRKGESLIIPITGLGKLRKQHPPASTAGRRHPVLSPLVQLKGRLKLLLLPAEAYTTQTPPRSISCEPQVQAL